MTQAKSENSPVDPAIVAADNAFGLNLLNTLLQVDSTDNTAIAPLSVALALQIVYNGAVGATQQAMAQTLQLGGLSCRNSIATMPPCRPRCSMRTRKST